jgi:transcriptional regulator of acetoin/glycerol metabolism
MRAVARGTLFIDELAQLDDHGQARLLEIIEESSVRVIGATTADLDAAVEEEGFSDSLFQALSCARVEVPPLRERAGDIVLLARKFWVELGGAGKLPADFLAGLARHRWPGNVTELRERVLARIVHGSYDAAELPENADFASLTRGDLPFSRARQAMLAAFEQRYVANLLERHDGNVTRAAAASGLALRYFQRIKSRRM